MSDRIVFLKPYGPEVRDERRRRRQRQRRFCCCLIPCLLVGAAAVLLLRKPVASLWQRMAEPNVRITPAPVHFPLQVEVDKREYRHYDVVRMRVVYTDNRGKPISDRAPSVVVLHDDEPVPTVGGMDRVPLHYEPSAGEWRANWPIPWNAVPGTYVFRATARIKPKDWVWMSVEERRKRLEESGATEERLPTVYDENKSQCVASARFEVVRPRRARLDPGLGALVLEATWNLEEQPIPLPHGGNSDWRAIFDWCDYIGANALWYVAGYTDARDTKLSLDDPWVGRYVEMVPKLAEEARRRGVQFGAYAIAYSTFGDRSRLPAYDYAWDVKAGRVLQTSFVSLDDVRRRQHLADWTKVVAAPEGTSYTGLDYIRTGSDGYEMVDEFVADMSVDVPDGWAGWPRERRIRWLQGKVEADWLHNPDMCDRWNWFRARKTALAVRDVIRLSGSPKPLWCFILGWKHGQPHGQDVVMFTDAGVAFNAVMLYEIDRREHHDLILKWWGEYIEPGQTNLVVGDTVNWRLHQRLYQPAGPEEMYRRITTATHMIPGELAKGVFVHDLSRFFMRARTGPYPGKEWAIAGAAAISKLRMDWGLYPLRVSIAASPQVPVGAPFTISVRLTGLTKAPLHNVHVELMQTQGVEAISARRLVVGSVPAGGTQQAAFQVRLPGHVADRKDRFMLAARVTWPDTPPQPKSEGLPQRITAIRYVNGR